MVRRAAGIRLAVFGPRSGRAWPPRGALSARTLPGTRVRALLGDVTPELGEVLREVKRSAAETRQHFEVATEALRGEIQQVAEGVASLSERVDRLEVNLREDILRSQRELSAMIRFS